VTEGNAATTAATFRVTRSGNITGASSVRVVTANGNATGGVDYTALPTTTVDFAAGVTSKPVTVSVTGDTAVEPNETFSLNLSSAVGAVISDSSGLATIVNDEPATYLAVSDVTITEGTGQTASAAFTLTRTGNLALTTTVKVATADGTAIKNSDYTALQSTTISLAPQETTKTIGVSVTGDTADEANESFTLTLTSPTGAVLSDAVGVATIVDNEGPVVPGPSSYISVGDFSLAEGNSGTKTGTFTLTRSGNLNQSSTVTFATVNGTATAGADYTARVATPLTFSPQQSTKTVSVTVLGDATLEANESFSLSLTSPINAVISDGIGAGTIANDDATYVSVADVMLAEGTAGPKAFVFNLTRTGSLGGSSSVNVVTGNGSALAGTDYTALLATPVSFAAGEVTKTVTVNATGDTAPEANETFSLVLSSPAGATVIDGTGTGTVLNDDGASYLSVGDIAAPELGPTTFTVSRSGNTTAPATVTVATSNGSALAGTDYTALAATTVTFAAGQTSKQVTITITGDSIDEPNETFWLGLSAPVGAVISDSSGLATIIDDERTL
jgi:chitinase